MNWTPKEFAHALVEMQWIQYRYRYDKEIADACDLIYKRIAEDRKNGVRMTDTEQFEKENQSISDIIQEGRFLNAKQGIELGRAIAEGFAKGIESIRNDELPTRLEGSD